MTFSSFDSEDPLASSIGLSLELESSTGSWMPSLELITSFLHLFILPLVEMSSFASELDPVASCSGFIL